MKTTNCRLCTVQLPEPILRLPPTPIANQFLKTKTYQEPLPLNLVSCNNCHHYQLDYSVPADTLFNEGYPFVSGTSPVNREHFRKYAEDVVKDFNLQKNDFILEIASNDGTLLKEFKYLGMKVLGIDPAIEIANSATKEGVNTIPDFFGEEKAVEILKKYGKPKIIIMNNALAHLDNVNEIIRGVKSLLDNDGVFIFENSYFLDVFNKKIYDVIYHEHPSQFLISPLEILFNNNGMLLFKIIKQKTHGGSIRGFASLLDGNSSREIKNVKEFIEEEKKSGLISLGTKNIKMVKFKEDLQKIKCGELLSLYINGNNKTVIYGAPAKLTTTLYFLEIDPSNIEYIIDDNPLKQGKFSPGKNIKVENISKLKENMPNTIWIIAWNFADSIKEKCIKEGFKGNFICFNPNNKLINIE